MESVEFVFEAIGTHWQINLELDDNCGLDKASLQKQIMTRIDGFDKTYSRFRADSLVTQIAQSAGTYSFPSDAQPLFALYKQLYELTHGTFTPLIGKVMEEAGYDARYSLKPGVLHTPPAWDTVMRFSSSQLTTTQPVVLDFGAAGKGYLIDIVSGLLVALGVKNFCVDAGGDIFYRNEADKKIRIGLENPENIQQVIGVVEMDGGSICGSAGNRRAWEGFHHIIDPHTLLSPQHILATWVVASTTMLADALATALFFTPAKELKKHFVFEYVILNADHSVEVGEHFPGEVFTN